MSVQPAAASRSRRVSAKPAAVSYGQLAQALRALRDVLPATGDTQALREMLVSQLSAMETHGASEVVPSRARLVLLYRCARNALLEVAAACSTNDSTSTSKAAASASVLASSSAAAAAAAAVESVSGERGANHSSDEGDAGRLAAATTTLANAPSSAVLSALGSTSVSAWLGRALLILQDCLGSRVTLSGSSSGGGADGTVAAAEGSEAAASTQATAPVLDADEAAKAFVQECNRIKTEYHDDLEFGVVARVWASVIELVRSPRAPVNIAGKQGYTPLHIAAFCGDHALVKRLLARGATVGAGTKKEGIQPLHVAAYAGHCSVVDELIRNGANPNAKDKDGWQPMHSAAQGGVAEVMVALTSKGADKRGVDRNGEQPIHTAALAGNLRVIKVLVRNNVSVEAKTKTQQQPIHFAVEGGFHRIVRYLVGRGASVEEPDEHGDTPMHIAATKANVAVVRTLLESGSRGLKANKDGKRPLHLLCETEHTPRIDDAVLECARMLLDRHDKETQQKLVCSRDNDEYEPLHRAASVGNLELVRLLLDRGARVSAKRGLGWQALHYAASKGHIEVARLLVERGADPMAMVDGGHTPQDEARGHGHAHVVEFLGFAVLEDVRRKRMQSSAATTESPAKRVAS